MREARVRVLVADDHPLFREALADTIDQRPELELLAKVASGREALSKIRGTPPEVAVLDMKMPELGGMEVVDAVTRDELPTRVLLLSAFLDSALAYRARLEPVRRATCPRTRPATTFARRRDRARSRDPGRRGARDPHAGGG